MIKRHSIELSAQEYKILRGLAKTPFFPTHSTQRLRFEMLGLAKDRPDGLWLTARGRWLASKPAPTAPLDKTLHEVSPGAARDTRGRKLPLRRHSPF